MRIITKNGNGTGVKYSINKNYDEWKQLKNVTKSGNKVTQNGNKITKNGNAKITKNGNNVTQNGNDVTKSGNKVTKNGNESLPKMVPSKDNTKDNYSKDNISKDNDSKDTLANPPFREIKSKKSKTSKSKKPPSTEHHRFIDYFCTRYDELFRTKYCFDQGKDGKLVQRLLKAYGYEKLVKMTDLFFAGEDKFVNEVGHSIGMLKTRAVALAEKLTGYSQTALHNLNAAQEFLEDDNAG